MADRPGSLRERVRLEREVRTADTGGGAQTSWAPLDHAPTVWARVEPLTGQELVQAMRLQARLTHKVTMRWRDDVTAAMRLVWGTRILNVRAVLNPDERRRYLELYCEEGAAA
ncbi:MAG: phage head closure protein [Alphaproteobacteria bacterium]